MTDQEGPAYTALWWRRIDTDYSSPCQLDPPMWDAPTGSGGRQADAEYARVTKAMAACKDCRVFDLCMDAAIEEGPKAVGIWAGIIKFDSLQSTMNTKIKKMLRGEEEIGKSGMDVRILRGPNPGID